MRKGLGITVGLVSGTCFAALLAPALAAESPYPPSEIITNVTWSWSTHDRRAPGSDNWATTWADDGHQYASWGDGGGFGGGNNDGRVGLGVARVEGAWDSYQGYNVWGGKSPENPAQFNGKSYGIISVDGVLYMWVGPGSNATSYDEARMCQSVNRGAVWQKASWAFVKADGIIMPTICNFGRDYAGARDGYVYHYFVQIANSSSLSVQKPGRVYLARVSKDRLMKGRTDYEWVSGFGGDHAPVWSGDILRKAPVFEDANGVGWCMSVSYNAGLRRYLLCTEHAQTSQGKLGIFDAPQPWGPWTTVGYYENWGGFGSTFYWNFSNKWLSKDGMDFTIIFTGTGANDSWNTVRGRFLSASSSLPRVP